MLKKLICHQYHIDPASDHVNYQHIVTLNLYFLALLWAMSFFSIVPKKKERT